ncbi:tannase/feruloyl esterase family alpha/beta hydrolase [Rhizobium leguminosarum]
MFPRVVFAAIVALSMNASTLEVADAGSLSVVQARSTCAALSNVDLKQTGGTGSSVTKTEEVQFQGTVMCSVEGILSPTIGFKVELPVSSWSQRYLQVGCGGLCGRTSLEAGAADGCGVLDDGGFVIASTDMGHQGMSGDFGIDPQKRVDFAYRAVHLTAMAAKTLIKAYYGQDAKYAYFNGCSDGGRQALVEAQRFPNDFDGIIAGAAAMNFEVQNSLYHGWQARSNTNAAGKPILRAPRLAILHNAVVKECDELDGLEDGLISIPSKCHFDVSTVQCKEGQDMRSCLSADEVAVARKLYDGPRDPVSGKRLTVGGPQFGSELAWAGVYVPLGEKQPIMSERIALEALRALIFEEPTPTGYKLSGLKFDQATFDRLRSRYTLLDATNPDLSAFEADGGKLIVWHGWADPHISPMNSIAYHQAVRKQMGEERAEGFERLYMLPGVYHCSGGEGPSELDLLTPLMMWVETGVAPDAILTRQAKARAANGFGQPGDRAPLLAKGGEIQAQGTTYRERPVYPYPFTAAYDGRGDVNKAESYARGASVEVSLPEWAGTDFYTPYTARMR